MVVRAWQSRPAPRPGRLADRQHVAIDPFQTTVSDDCGAVAIEQADLVGYLDLQRSLSAVALPRFVEGSKRFDFVYVDGSHLVEDVFIDAYYVARLLADNGIVALTTAPLHTWPKYFAS